MNMTRHIVITGNAVNHLPTLSVPETTLLTVSEAPENVRRDLAVTTLVIADDLNFSESWDNWWERETRLHKAFDTLMPLLTPSSNGLFIGFSNTDDRRERATLRAGIDHLIAHYQSFAATRGGKEFTINGIEVPATHDAALLASRLREHCKRKTVFANGIVVPLEELREQSIADAMASSFI